MILGFIMVCLGCAPGDYVEVQRGDIVHSFVAQGRIESENTIEIMPEVSARISEIHVEEGDTIVAGQVLVTLDASRLQSDYDRAFHALASAKAQFDQIRTGTRAEILAQARATVAEAMAAADAADANLAQVLRGPREEDIRNAERLFDAAKADELVAEKNLRRLKPLSGAGAASATDLDAAQGAYDAAVALRLSRQAQLDLLRKGATKEERAQARASAASAHARVDQAEADLERLTTGATIEELQLAEARYEQASAELERARIELADTRIKSPVSGIVLRKYHEPGEFVYPQMQQPIFVVCDDSKRLVHIEVSEGDVYKLRTGLPAVITSIGYVGREWKGRVTRIASVMGRKRLFSERPSEKTDVQVLEAWIEPEESLSLPINLPIEVRVEEVIVRNVPVLPSRVVNREGWLVRPGGQRQQVTLGARDDGFVHIVSGLDIGDRVMAPQ